MAENTGWIDQSAAAAQLVLRERQCRDRGWFDEMSACFFADSRVRLSWFTGGGREFVEASREMAERGQQNSHRLGAPVVRRNDDRFLIEVPAEIVFTLSEGSGGHLISWTRLIYRVEWRAGVLGIVALDVVYERDAMVPVATQDQVPFARRSYAALAAHLAISGYQVEPDLLGDDRPADVSAFYQDALRWLDSGRHEFTATPSGASASTHSMRRIS